MCNGFSCIVLRNGSINWIEPNSYGDVSHSDILYRMAMPDTSSVLNRSFVRTENTKWTEESFRWDEADTLPTWIDEEEVKEKVNLLMLRVRAIVEEHSEDTKPLIENAKKKVTLVVNKYYSVPEFTYESRVEEINNIHRVLQKKLDRLEEKYLNRLSTITGYVKVR